MTLGEPAKSCLLVEADLYLQGPTALYAATDDSLCAARNGPHRGGSGCL